MGCYLSKVDDKVYITEGKGRNFQYASASCQGWRRDQEDAEICLSDFDENASLFILCDGHGGPEVAKYTVAHLPEFIKNHQFYKEGKYEELLTNALIDFDAHLRTDEVMAELEKIAHDAEEKTSEENVTETNTNSVSEGSSSVEPATDQAGGSSSAPGPSTSASNGLSSVAEDVDTETLRREAQLPLDVLINKYANPATKSRIVSLNQSTKDSGNEAEGESKHNVDGDVSSDQPEPSSSKAGTEEGPSSTSGDSSMTGLELLKKVYMEQFDDSEDDSEFEGTDESEDDEDSDDGDDERDEDTPGERGKKVLSKKHKKLSTNNKEASSADEEEDSENESSSEDDDDGSDDDKDDDEDSDDYDFEDEDEEDDEDARRLIDNIGKISGRERMAMLTNKMVKSQNIKVHRAGMDSGCTVVVALVKDKKLYVASAGDSRCIMIMRDGKCQPMSFDHKPEDQIELQRILKAGGIVCEGRVNGGLNLSRALGDFTYKDPKLDARDQMITSCPDVKVADLDPDQVEYILLACDGIWNSYDSEAVSEYIRKVAPTMNDLAEICAALFKLCLAPNCDGDGTGCDNMTCILIKFEGSNKTDSSNNQNDLKLSSTTNNSEEGGDEMKKECEQKQSTKRQPDGEAGGDSDNKRRCFHLLPQSTES